MSQSFASDYIDVATRIAEVRGDAERHYPDGSFQAWEPFRMVEVDGATYVAYTAAFYRTPDDPRPGIGSAWEQVPGKTAFTRGSELQNAETSAWGRALIAALAADSKKGIASADEVRARQAERDQPPTCARCGEVRPSVEAMRDHMVEAHGWIRHPDGKVSAPKAGDGADVPAVPSPEVPS